MRTTLTGYQILGGAAEDSLALVIKVKNIAEVVAKQGGAAGKLAQQLAPLTIANTVYNAMKDKMAAGFAEQGVVADIAITSSVPTAKPTKGEFLAGVVVGGVGVGAVAVGGWALWKYVISRFFVKS